jgi:hypothetical protein
MTEINAMNSTVTMNEIDGKDREQMTEEALFDIRKAGTAAALENCLVLAEQINAQLERATSEHFVDTSWLSDLQAFLERAAAVLKRI